MFLSLAVTGSVIEFSQVGAAFIDGLITSNMLGSDAMAAVGIVHPVFSILGVISGLIAVGMQIRCTGEIGRGNVKNMNRFFSAAMIGGTAVSLIITLLLTVFARPFVMLLGAEGKASELTDMAMDYAIGIGVGAPGLILSAVLAPALQLDSDGKTIRTGALICTVSDIVLDIAAVKLNTGVLGIAFATSISNYLYLLYQCTHFLRKDRMLRFVRPDVSVVDFFKMLSDGGEKAVKRSVNILRPVILNNVIISYGGAMAMAALSIHGNFSGFSEIALSGIAEAVVLLAGLYYGEVNKEAIGEVGRCTHRTIAVSSGLICAILLIFAEPLASLYVPADGELKKMVAFAIRMLALENPMAALINSRIKYLQAIHRKLNMNLLIFSARLFFVLVCAFTLGRLFGVYGILACFMAGDLLALIAIFLFHQIKSRKPLPSLNDFLSLPPEFDLSPADVISLHIRDVDDMTLTSEQIGLFCKGHKFSKRICYYAALVFEELSSNIITHGFPLNKSGDPIVDIRLVARGNRLILRLRDNCPQFDITKKIIEVNAEGADPTRNFGIRITSKIAKDIRYTNAFETNTIIIEYEDAEKSPS